MLRRFGSVIALSAALTACNKAPEQPKMPPPVVTFITVQEEPVQLTAELPGRTSPFAVSEVRPQINGIVLKPLTQEFARVRGAA